MGTVKVTVTLPEEQLAAIRDLVAEGRAPNVSAFVQHAVGVSLNDVAGWAHTLAEALEETGGPLTEEEREWADDVLAGGHKVAWQPSEQAPGELRPGEQTPGEQRPGHSAA